MTTGMNITTETIYKCNHCGNQFKTQEEAENCFIQDNTCICRKYDRHSFGAHHTSTDRYGDYHYDETILDFKKAGFFNRKSCSGDERDLTREYDLRCDVKYCPWCGRELIKESEETTND